MAIKSVGFFFISTRVGNNGLGLDKEDYALYQMQHLMNQMMPKFAEVGSQWE